MKKNIMSGKNRNFIMIIIGISLAIATVFFFDEKIQTGITDGDSMDSTLEDGDIFLFRSTGKEALNIGDVIVFIPPKEAVTETEEEDVIYVKRIIAAGGDHLVIKDSKVYVNGGQLPEAYIRDAEFEGDIDMVVPRNELFVMGDNRNESKDSRSFGTIKESSVKGVVIDFCLRK